mmetsp:Transcript_4785/g.8299  ORF Transcript_4785/g.8299 Transcript_4785/m.8299 type:complete len:128 (-) Transcript_4785:141-524(-)
MDTPNSTRHWFDMRLWPDFRVGSGIGVPLVCEGVWYAAPISKWSIVSHNVLGVRPSYGRATRPETNSTLVVLVPSCLWYTSLMKTCAPLTELNCYPIWDMWHPLMHMWTTAFTGVLPIRQLNTAPHF